jgi:hypothetical protein
LSEEAFRNPPPAAGVETWWHWMDGVVSKDGLTRDLDSMKEQGLRRATITLVGFKAAPDAGAIELMSPGFFELIKHTAAEARQRGIQLGVTAGPGWSGAGGPWIPVEQSMKRVTFSTASVEGGKKLDLELPPLPANAMWAQDTFVLAWPDPRTPARLKQASQILNDKKPLAADILCDGNPNTLAAAATPRDGKIWRLAFSFPEDYPAEKVALYLKSTIWKREQEVTVSVTSGGRTLVEKKMPNSQMEAPFSLEFPRTTAKEYEVQIQLPADSGFRADQFSVREAEFLDKGESPQWTCEFRDWASQISDASGSLYISAGASLTPSPVTVASDKVIDLTAHRDGNRLTWDAPAGRWNVVRFGYTTTDQKIRPVPPGGAGFESDKMSAEATELQYRSFIKPILEAAGSDNREAFTLLMADSWESGMQNWCVDFPAQFSKRRGYDLLPWMPALAGATVGSKQETVRFFNDFRETISDLVVENYYEKFRALANADKLEFGAEFAFAGPRIDAFKMTRALDVPMYELWSDRKDGGLPDIPEGTVRPSAFANAAELYGKRVFSYELFTAFRADWRRTPGDFSYVADLAFCMGMTQATLHSMMHQPDERKPGLTLQGFGQHFQRHNTWWALARDWLTELARKQYVFQNTAAAHDLLAYYGDTLPRSEANMKEFTLPENSQPLFVDHDALLKRVTVKDGKLKLDGKGSFACLLLPSSTMFSSGYAMDVATLRRIRDLVAAGAVVIGRPPARTPGLLDFRRQDAELGKLADELWKGLKDDGPAANEVGKGRVYRTMNAAEVLAGLGYVPDLQSKAPPGMSNLKYSRRLAKEGEAYFLFNPNDEAATFDCDVADTVGRRPELWNAANGSKEPMPVFRFENGRTKFSVRVPARNSIFVVLRSPGRPMWVGVEPALDGVTFGENAQRGLVAVSEKSGAVALHNAEGGISRLSFADPRGLELKAPWKLRFVQLPDKPEISLTELKSWTELDGEKLKNYSGLVSYETTVEVPETFLKDAGRVDLDLGEVGRVCRIKINGKDAGTLWRKPWRVAVGGLLQQGTNTITIEVANSWYNRLMADQALPETERQTWTTWPRMKEWQAENAGPEKSGLLAPVTLVAYPAVSLKSE